VLPVATQLTGLAGQDDTYANLTLDPADLAVTAGGGTTRTVFVSSMGNGVSVTRIP
jgi:hypothetical protein